MVPFTPSISINVAITLVILLSLESMESLWNRVATRFEATQLFSMKAELLASSQSCCSVDSVVWCKRALMSRFTTRTDEPRDDWFRYLINLATDLSLIRFTLMSFIFNMIKNLINPLGTFTYWVYFVAARRGLEEGWPIIHPILVRNHQVNHYWHLLV